MEESWQLWNEVFINKPTKYWIQEFYTGKKIKISNKEGKQLFELDSKKIKAHNKICDYDSQIHEILRKIVKSKRRLKCQNLKK